MHKIDQKYNMDDKSLRMSFLVSFVFHEIIVFVLFSSYSLAFQETNSAMFYQKWQEPIQNITSIPEAEQCPAGTQVCGIVTHTRSSEPDTIPKADEVIPIAGDFPNAPAAVIERLKTKTASTEGLLITLAGGEYSGKKQKAVIKFICDQAKTGWEGQDSKPAEDSKIDVLGETSFGRRDDKEEKSLKFVGYDKEVLQLDWRTKYACESTSSGGSAKGGKGFFTWFIIMLVFDFLTPIPQNKEPNFILKRTKSQKAIY